MNIALIGTDGLPARYGGFETFVEQLAPRLVGEGHTVRVVGSSKGRTSASMPRNDGVQVFNINLSANGASSVLFDFLSFARIMFWADAVVLLGVSAGIFLPLMRQCMRHGRLIINVDGLESRRAKWVGLRRIFLSWSESIAVRSAPAVVADNEEIAKILIHRYKREATTIAYGADHVQKPDLVTADRVLRTQFFLEPTSYALTVARIEPENHIAEMIEGFLASQVSTYVLVGNFGSTVYGRELKARYLNQKRVMMIESNYDPLHLASLRSRCRVYLHGHSVGGTNPSLVEMLPYRRPILAWDCQFNRATLRGECGYFDSPPGLTHFLKYSDLSKLSPSHQLSTDPAYCWDSITLSYLKLISSLST